MPSSLITSLASLALAASSAVALPANASSYPTRPPPAGPGNDHSAIADCIDTILPITITTNSTTFDVPRVDSDIDAVDFAWSVSERAKPDILSRVKGVRQLANLTLDVRVQLCVPKQAGPKSTVLQVATHGGAAASAYWDPTYQPANYSYVAAALAAGYSILWYDRIGTGLSSKADAYSVVQFPPQVQILRQLVQLARSGSIPHPSNPKFTSTVLVGHSLGSVISALLVASYPSLADACILTGFAVTPYLGTVGQEHYSNVYAENAPPVPMDDGTRFRGRGSGYVVSASASAVQQNFFKKPFFDPGMLAWATANVRETATVGEAIGLPYVVRTFKAPEYAGKVLLVVGEHDYDVCDGDCNGVVNKTAIRANYFPKSELEFYQHPGSGHALTLHYNATGHYESILKYLGDNGF